MTELAYVTAAELSDYELAPGHPFKPIRVKLTETLLESCGLLQQAEMTAPGKLNDRVLTQVHDSRYVDLVRELSSGRNRDEGYAHGLGTGDNPIFPGMHDAISLVCAATTTALELVASGQAVRAVNFAGGLHHAHPSRASGFCVYNDLAVAIEQATRQHGVRVACIDLDAHHGDGTQEIFYERDDVLTISLHESGRYLFPGTGHTYELGRGGGRGTSVNAPLEPFTEDASYLEVFETVVPRALDWFRPDIIVLQGGADSHVLDPLADLSLSLTGMTAAWRRVRELADQYCDGRLVVTGGGGYDALRTVPRAWAQLFALTAGSTMPSELPLAWREQWAEQGIPDLPSVALDSPADFTEQPRRRAISNQNRSMLGRLDGAIGPVWRQLSRDSRRQPR